MSDARENMAHKTMTIWKAVYPSLRDIQDFLSARLDRRAILLELIERAPSACLDHPRPPTVRECDLCARVSARRPRPKSSAFCPPSSRLGRTPR